MIPSDRRYLIRVCLGRLRYRNRCWCCPDLITFLLIRKDADEITPSFTDLHMHATPCRLEYDLPQMHGHNQEGGRERWEWDP